VSALLVSRIDTTKLYPPFFSALSSMLDEALKQGASYWAVSGFRTYGEQMALWQQGRTEPGKRVTNAKGGESAHNFGIAVDLVRDGLIDRKGLQPDYAPESYELLRTLAPKFGLVWGGSWKFRDNPHVQMPNYVTGRDLEPLRYSYELGGLVNVFQYLDKGTP
jgi:hypothetical protein